jgi:hypothetical protein
MSGRHVGGVRGTVLLRGVCPVCRREVAGGNSESGDARNSRIMLRQHNNPATGERCAGSRDRVPTDWDRTNAWGRAKRGTVEQAIADAKSGQPWHETPGEPENPTGCPACGSDDYDTELGGDGQPDHENGLKTCQECGEQWV